MRLRVSPAGRPLAGTVQPPGDKSISHRALLFGGLADGQTRIRGLLVSGDTNATRRAMEQLGAQFEDGHDGVTVTGIGAAGPRAPEGLLDMGNSGTAMRLLAGVLAGQPFDSVLSGDVSLNSRPMGRIIRPLELMGAEIEAEEGGRAPLRVKGRSPLAAIDYRSPVASAQVKSCVLLAGLYADGVTRVTEPHPSRDHTERMLPQFGVSLGEGPSVEGGQRLQGTDVTVPADPSSAAFLVAAALLVPGSDVTVIGVGLNPTRDGLFRVLERMGARIDRQNLREAGGEPVADLRVRHSPDLVGVDVPAAWIPSMIDEVPVLLAIAARARGTTRIREAEELRVKESDRLAVMARGLAALGVSVRETRDGIDVEGGPSRHATVESSHDHRCAMSFAVLALCTEGGVTIDGAEYIDTSYPDFRRDLASLGAVLETEA
ncbi:MAG: 3-phosphoshikimate 1-carboxyvinyltransferase [Xanthomonadales bacterium]|jgi:3-phosphoshikimate 1-carboxyvinyltransferase|nr:3-phosphoshikimate 1-carboxyvinyltransferase [Xanthomonadales bacterium]